MTSLVVSPNKFAKLPGITKSLSALGRITQKELLVIQKFAKNAYLGANLLVAVEKADLVIHNGVTMARKMAETIQAYEKYVGRTLTKLETLDTVRKVEQRLAPVTKGIGRGIQNGLAKMDDVLVKPLGKGSTGRNTPKTLQEKLTLKEVLSNPLKEAKDLSNHVPMSDPRWTAKDGWVKMSRNVNGTEIHYVYNKKLGLFDDFKFK